MTTSNCYDGYNPAIVYNVCVESRVDMVAGNARASESMVRCRICPADFEVTWL